MNIEYDHDGKIFDKAVVSTNGLLKIRENTENLESILEEENLIEYIFNELDSKRECSKNEFISLQKEKINLSHKFINILATIFAMPFVEIYSQGIFKAIILTLLSISTICCISEFIDKIKDIKNIKKSCTVFEAQQNLLVEKLNLSKKRLQNLTLEDRLAASEKVVSKEIDMKNIKELDKKLEMYEYLIENDDMYKKYLNYVPLGNEFDNVFFTDKDINHIKSAKKRVKKR